MLCYCRLLLLTVTLLGAPPSFVSVCHGNPYCERLATVLGIPARPADDSVAVWRRALSRVVTRPDGTRFVSEEAVKSLIAEVEAGWTPGVVDSAQLRNMRIDRQPYREEWYGPEASRSAILAALTNRWQDASLPLTERRMAIRVALLLNCEDRLIGRFWPEVSGDNARLKAAGLTADELEGLADLVSRYQRDLDLYEKQLRQFSAVRTIDLINTLIDQPGALDPNAVQGLLEQIERQIQAFVGSGQLQWEITRFELWHTWRLVRLAAARKDEIALARCKTMLNSLRRDVTDEHVQRWLTEALTLEGAAPRRDDIRAVRNPDEAKPSRKAR